ncbi:hypothetical protein C8D70_105123 [Chryseobacterium sp. CBTAP 102]|nr:hypothetical protein C8D70_105123 [Chryseobacterium sp. CBTAP 102]
MKKLQLILLLLFYSFTFSQVGINTITPDPNSVLDVVSDTKGVLIPRVVLTDLNLPNPLTLHVRGMIVYNKSTFGSAVTQGFYYNDGEKWVKVNEEVASLVSFDTTDPNIVSTLFTPNVTANPNSVYSSSVDGSFWKYDTTTSKYITYQPKPSTEWYLNGTTTDAAANKNIAIYRIGEVGIGSDTNINPSAMLDVNSSTKGFLPPRMKKTVRDAITKPAAGLIVYCTDCRGGDSDGCLNYNFGTPDNPTWECLGEPKGAIVSIDCPGSSIEGNYIVNVANTAANVIKFKIDNNTFAPITGNFTNYVTLSGATGGLSVSGPTPAQPITINAGASAILSYTISGTPTVPGPFKARFAGNGLVCEKSGEVLNSSIVVDCANAFVYGMTPIKYLKAGTTYSGGTVRIPYKAYQSGITYPAQTVTLPSGITLTRAAGTFATPSGFVEYTIGGTYSGSNCAIVTADINVEGNSICNVVIGDNQSDYLSGVYKASSDGYGNSCPATQFGMTDTNYSSGWASPNTTANQWVEITFPSMGVRKVVLSGGPVSCWAGNASYVSYYANQAGLQLEYWNGSSWVGLASVPTLYQDRVTIIDINCDTPAISRLRVRNNTAQWWGIGTFYPVGYWDSKVTPPVLDCEAAVVSLSPSNTLINGQSYTGTVTVNYTATLASSYNAEVVSKSGLTLTRAAGNMVNGSGSIVYNVSGTYTGNSYKEETFPISLIGSSCEVTLGNPTEFKTGTYSASSSGYGNTCPATQASMTDSSYTTGWASPNTAADQFIEINFGTAKVVKKIAVSAGPVTCWAGNAQWVSAYANVAGLQFEYWNGSSWVGIAAVPTVTQNSITTYVLSNTISTSKIRVRNNTAQWWGLATFYPFVY